MNKLISYCFIYLIVACSDESSTSQSPLPIKQTSPIGNHTDFYPPVTQPVSFATVEGLPYEPSSVTRFYGASSLQFSEYWQPTLTSGTSQRQAIIIVHGGCWSNSFRINQSYPLATALSLNGFHVWSVEYRATGDTGGGWPGTVEDVSAAIDNIIATSSDLYSQRSHLILGHSAGGHLALLAIHQREEGLNNDVSGVGIAAITNISAFAAQSGGCNVLARSFMNGTPESIPEQYSLATPDLNALSERIFLFNGSQDWIVPTTQAINAGLPFEIVEGVDHFDWLHPGTAAFSRLLDFLLSNT